MPDLILLLFLYAYNITMPPKKRPNSRANTFISRSRDSNTVGIEEADAITILESTISSSRKLKPRRIPIAEEVSPSSVTNTRGKSVRVAHVVDASPKGYFRKLWKRFTQRNRKVVPVDFELDNEPQLMPKRSGGKTRRFHRRK
jgi:hypothetical protein